MCASAACPMVEGASHYQQSDLGREVVQKTDGCNEVVVVVVGEPAG